MKYLVIGAIIICIIIITNLLTFTTTIIINDYLWRNHTAELESEVEDEILLAIHRTCMDTVKDNKICNKVAKDIYDSYQKDWNPLPGLDLDFIKKSDDDSVALKGK